MTFFQLNIKPHITSKSFYLFWCSLGLTTLLWKRKNRSNNTLYFLLHFLFNSWCVYENFDKVISCINQPTNIYNTSNIVSFYTVQFHLYHILLTKGKLTNDEIFHHLMVFFVAPSTWINHTIICNFGLFFMTGLPGGITYLLLLLTKLNLIDSINEKRISKHLNMWIRAPGCVLTAYLGYLNHFDTKKNGILYNSCVLASSSLILWNGMYFASTSIKSYELSKQKFIKI